MTPHTAPNPTATPCFIKLRERGRRSWSFLSRNGTNRLRIRAARFSSKEAAQKVIESATPDNPQWEFKIVPAGD
jgi:phosphopantetheinyl transferase (holo-ACP synthase)